MLIDEIVVVKGESLWPAGSNQGKLIFIQQLDKNDLGLEVGKESATASPPPRTPAKLAIGESERMLSVVLETAMVCPQAIILLWLGEKAGIPLD